jgi:hypothetical protein
LCSSQVSLPFQEADEEQQQEDEEQEWEEEQEQEEGEGSMPWDSKVGCCLSSP